MEVTRPTFRHIISVICLLIVVGCCGCGVKGNPTPYVEIEKERKPQSTPPEAPKTEEKAP